MGTKSCLFLRRRAIQRAPAIALILAAALAVSCATTGELDTLRSEVGDLKASNRDLEAKLNGFLEKYDSQLRKELDMNIEQVELELKRLETTRDKAITESGLISQYLESARKDKDQTALNRLQSDSSNVVREFDALKVLWQDTRQQLMKSVNDAQKAAISADIQAQSSYKSLVEYEMKMVKVESLYKSLNDWADKFQDFQDELDKLEKAQRDSIQGIDSLNRTTSQLAQRLQMLERGSAAAADLQKQLEKINAALAALTKRVEALEKTASDKQPPDKNPPDKNSTDKGGTGK
jgi:chromosome segregation ATPase